MSAPATDKLASIRQLVGRAPDAVVAKLKTALAAGGADAALSAVRVLVEAESAERAMRLVVLGPVMPLFRTAASATDAWPHFPPAALDHLWLGLKRIAPDAVRAAAEAAGDPDYAAPGALDAPTRLAGQELHARHHPEFAAAAALCDAACPGGGELLATCLDVAPLARPAIDQLPSWLAHMDGERIAVARLACRDAGALSDNGGPVLFDILAAHLAEPWRILRVISAVMDHPGDRYLAASELAVFGERVLDEIDRQIAALALLKAEDGPAAAVVAARAAARAATLVAEMTQAVELAREGPWGRRVRLQKQQLAEIAEGYLRQVEDAVLAALPSRPGRAVGKGHPIPVLDADPDPRRVARAKTLLTFVQETRASAGAGGFAALRGKLLERLEQRLDAYVEEVLERLRADGPEAARGRVFLALAADIYGLARDGKAAEIVRRRLAAA